MQKKLEDYDWIIRQVSMMTREQAIERLAHFDDLPLDFSTDYLHASSTEHIQHLLAAALWRSGQRTNTSAGAK